MKTETIAIHTGNRIDPHSGAVVQPVTLSSTYQRGPDGIKPDGYIYSRMDNPNRRSLENVIARLEGAEDACAFASGNAAAGALFQALKPGSHIIAADDMYHGLRTQLIEVFGNILDIDFADLTDLDAVAKLIRKETRLIWIESPSNPLLKICDIRKLVALMKPHGILVACDNTFSTPIFQQPLSLGCDIVMHSTTKYLGGHSDVLGGVLATSAKNELWEKIRKIQILAGAVPSPFDCYLTVRGIKTLPYRMRGHAENALQVALYLESHSHVEKVYYPGLESHDGYEIAKSQMSSPGAMLSFLVKGGAAEALKIVNAVRIFTQATSLGGVESLIEHRASLEGPGSKTPLNLIRVSVGLENIEDLVHDLQQAFDSID